MIWTLRWARRFALTATTLVVASACMAPEAPPAVPDRVDVAMREQPVLLEVATPPDDPAHPRLEHRYIVTFHDSEPNPARAAERLAELYGLRVRHVYEANGKGAALAGPPGLIRALARVPGVAYVEPDLEVWAVGQLGATGVSRMGATRNALADIDYLDDGRVDADIAIIDTGVDSAHPDLVVYRAENFTAEDGEDGNGHGTLVAGVAAAVDNLDGTVGVAPGARVWNLKVLGSGGYGSLSDVIAALDWLARHGQDVEVANMSLSAVGRSRQMERKVRAVVDNGTILVAAAGNDFHEDVYGADRTLGTDDDIIPAAYPEVSTISALADGDGVPGGFGPDAYFNPDDTLAQFSNVSYGAVPDNPVVSPGGAIDVAAPGADIRVITPTWAGSPSWLASGTSLAAPYATGAYALHVASQGRPTDAVGVAAARQALIDAADPQWAWGPADTNDPDGYPEGALAVASAEYPTIAGFAPTNRSQVTGVVDVIAPVAGPAPIAEVSFAAFDFDDPGPLLFEPLSPDANGEYSAPWDSAAAGPDGPIAMVVRAEDTAGRFAVLPLEVVLENVDDPPTIVSYDVSDIRGFGRYPTYLCGGYLGEEGFEIGAGTLTYWIRASDDRTPWDALQYAATVDPGTSEAVALDPPELVNTWARFTWDSRAFPEGPHTVVGTVIDEGGRQMDTGPWDITIDQGRANYVVAMPEVTFHPYGGGGKRGNRNRTNCEAFGTSDAIGEIRVSYTFARDTDGDGVAEPGGDDLPLSGFRVRTLMRPPPGDPVSGSYAFDDFDQECGTGVYSTSLCVRTPGTWEIEMWNVYFGDPVGNWAPDLDRVPVLQQITVP